MLQVSNDFCETSSDKVTHLQVSKGVEMEWFGGGKLEGSD